MNAFFFSYDSNYQLINRPIKSHDHACNNTFAITYKVIVNVSANNAFSYWKAIKSHFKGSNSILYVLSSHMKFMKLGEGTRVRSTIQRMAMIIIFVL